MRATFSIDEATRKALERLSRSRGQSKSAIVREAVVEYEARRDRLTERERQEQLSALATFKQTPILGDQAQVEAELAEIRASRQAASRDRE